MVAETFQAVRVGFAFETVGKGLLALEALPLVEVVVLRLALLAHRVVVALPAALEQVSAARAPNVPVNSVPFCASLALAAAVATDAVRNDVAVGAEPSLGDEVALEAPSALGFGVAGLTFGNEVGAVQTLPFLGKVIVNALYTLVR